MTTALPYIWFLIIGFEIALYLVLDGADLGIGILTLFPQPEDRRSLMMHVVGPIWDANETWLVIAGGTLFGAFPLAYGVILNALYIPIMMMVFGLIIRAAAFEFRAYAAHARFWSRTFGLASVLAVLGQAFVVSGLLDGITVQHGQFSGGPFDWFSPLSLLTTLAIFFGYILVGYAYLIKKTAYELRHEHFEKMLSAAIVMFAAALGAALVLPHEHYVFFLRWSQEPTRSVLIVLTALIAVTAAFLVYGTFHKKHWRYLHPACLVIFLLALAGLVVGIFPYIVPPSITIAEAASSTNTLLFMLYGIGPLIPIVLAYNVFLYHVFRGGRDTDPETEY